MDLVATAVQVVGAVVALVGLVMLVGPWWSCLVAGVALVAVGYLAERAQGPLSGRSDRRSGPNEEGAV